MLPIQARKSLPALLLLSSLWGCSGGSSTTSGIAGQGGFQLTLITVPAGETEWQINRPIEFHFNDDVDFTSINLNSIQIRELDGNPAAGEFTRKEVTLPSGGKLVLQARVFVDVPEWDRLFWLRSDDYLQLNLAWFF